LSDYTDIMEAPDLKHKPQINEFEFNTFLLFEPAFQARHSYEVEHGVVNMSTLPLLHLRSIAIRSRLTSCTDYGLLTILSGKLSRDLAPVFTRELESLAADANLTAAELLLSWALDCLDGIVVSSTSQPDRARRMADLFLSEQSTPLDRDLYRRLENAAREDGYEGKVFYKHGHMDAAAVKNR
jgi:diketogulonate reductase-like aldo/keto reductase